MLTTLSFIILKRNLQNNRKDSSYNIIDIVIFSLPIKIQDETNFFHLNFHLFICNLNLYFCTQYPHF